MKVKALKNDLLDGKVSRRFIHPETLNEMGRAMEAGAIKYKAYNFMLGHTATQLLDAAMRHIELYMWGEDVDEDTSKRLGRDVSHLGCALANLNMLIAQKDADTLFDNRYKGHLEKTTVDKIKA